MLLFFLLFSRPLSCPDCVVSKLPPPHVLLTFMLMLFLPNCFAGFCSSLVLLSEKDLCDRMEKPVSKEAPRVPFIQEVQHGTPSEPLTSERPPDTGPLLLPHS